MQLPLFPQDFDGTAPIHASCVAVAGRGLLIMGASGTGKSTMALHLMALGAQLVADDRVYLRAENGCLVARSVPELRGTIEARGLGLLRADYVEETHLAAMLDLDRTETTRLPDSRKTRVLGCSIPLLFRIEGPHSAPALLQFLKCGLRGDL